MNDLTRIISDLEHQRDAIQRAIAALREVGESEQPQTTARSATPTKSARKRGQLSEEGRRRIAEAARRRWAAKRRAAKKAANKQSATAPTPTSAVKKSATKQSTAKKAVPKKAAAKKSTLKKSAAKKAAVKTSTPEATTDGVAQ